MTTLSKKKAAFRTTRRGELKLANSAMGGDVVRGIVEALTNADDSYSRLAASNNVRNGQILIEIDRTPKKRSFTVRDRAEGMIYEEMDVKLREKGLSSSGFDAGENVRGNLGFGLKDLVGLGSFQFESIKDDKYSCFAVTEFAEDDEDKIVKNRPATKADRDRLNVRKNGSSVTVFLKTGVKLPNKKTLLEKIKGHYELRDINSSSDRTVRLKDSTSDRQEKIRYVSPLRELVYEEQLIIPKYPKAETQITIYRNEERDQSTLNDPARHSGIIVQGRKAAYENTLFSFESIPAAHQFSGLIKSPYIDDLINDYDQRFEQGIEPLDNNPVGILKPDRQGLEGNHPFRKSLQQSVESILKDFVDKEEKQSGRMAKLSDSMQGSLSELNKDLSRQIEQDLEEIDEQSEIVTDESRPSPFLLIPNSLYILPEETRSLTVRVANDLVNPSSRPKVNITPNHSLSVVSISEFKNHRSMQGFKTAQIKLKASPSFQSASIRVDMGDSKTTGIVNAELSGPLVDVPIIEDFRFQYSSSQIKVNKKKSISIYMPDDVYDLHHSLEPTVIVDKPEVFTINLSKPTFFDEDLNVYQKVITVEGKQFGSKGEITAMLGNEKVTCNLKVGEHGSGTKLDWEFLDEERGHLRAATEITPDGVKILIMGNHPVNKKYFGAHPDYSGQDSMEGRIVLSEIVATAIAEQMVEKVTKEQGDLDAAYFNYSHREYVNKYLKITHKHLTKIS